MAFTVDGSNGLTFPDSTTMASATQLGLRNRIINGAMVIDQRNAGASVTPNNSYTLDRWIYENTQTGKATVQQNAGSVTPPTGFSNYLGIVSTSAYSVGASDTFLLTQKIEGFNIVDFAWGGSGAQSVTLSFYVRSSLTGTFGGSITNNGSTRTYLFSYSINSANTWEYKTITIPGDTTGTWLTNNGIGLVLRFGLGSGSTFSGAVGWQTGNIVQPTGTQSLVGTNGATFYITGVQLERGSAASPFDWRPYGTELALCQRYYAKTFPQATAPAQNVTFNGAVGAVAPATGAAVVAVWVLPVVMRASPTMTTFSPSAASANWSANPAAPTASFLNTGDQNVSILGLTNTAAGNGYSIHMTASAEL